MTDEERILKAIDHHEQAKAELDEVPDLMFSNGGVMFPDQRIMTSMLRVLTDAVEESYKNRLNGEEDSPRVKYATELLWEIHDDQTFRELNQPEA
jgi:hypothetical protein